MRRTLTKLLLRRSPRRLDPHLPTAELHATLTPVDEEDEDGGQESAVINLFGANPPLSALETASEVIAPTEGSTVARTPVGIGVSEGPTIESPTTETLSPPPAKQHAQPMASPEDFS
jgi:hypothetical protein